MHQQSSAAEVLDVIHTAIIGQPVNDSTVTFQPVEINNQLALGRRMESESAQYALKSGTNFEQQQAAEARRDLSGEKITTARTDEEAVSGAQGAERQEKIALEQNTEGHINRVLADTTGEKGNTLSERARTEQAVVEETTRIQFSEIEEQRREIAAVEDQTDPAVLAEMEQTGAVEPTKDLEAALKLAAQAPAGPASPKA